MTEWHRKVYHPKTGTDRFRKKSWLILLEKVIKRDGGKCKACGATSRLTAHHIISRKNGGKDAMKNLETLCVRCHNKIEIGEDVFVVDKFEEGQDWHEWVYGGFRKPTIAY